MIRFIFSSLLVTAAFGAELVIPNQTPGSWEPGVSNGTGVVGGTAQYRVGGASARTVLHNIVDEGADPTGASSSLSALNAAIAATGAGEVVDVPYGVFLLPSPAYNGAKSNWTFRGRGPGVKSTSTVTIGTGAKTFDVPAGLGWTAGVGIRIWIHNHPDKWLMGTVTSYSGTTLVVNSTSTSGATDTSSLWIVGQTHIISVFAQFLSFVSQSAPADTLAITGSPAAGASTITVSDTTNYAVGRMVMIDLLNGDGHFNSQFYERNRVMRNIVTAKTGTTLTLAVPLVYALPVSLEPRVGHDQGLHATLVGMEDFSISQDGAAADAGPTIDLQSGYQCWVYNVNAYGRASGIWMQNSVRCEIERFYCPVVDYIYSIGIMVTGNTVACLVHHSGFLGNPRALIWYSSGNDVGNNYEYNFGRDGLVNLNHDAYNVHNLLQYNLLPGSQNDGFYAGSHGITHFRNWMYGDTAGAGWIILNRGAYYTNQVGNVQGSLTTQGAISYGNPYIGNGSNSGNTSNVLAYVDGGRTDPSLLPLHLDEQGEPRITGTVASHTSDSMTITINGGHTMADFKDPHNIDSSGDYRIMAIRWGPGREGFHIIKLAWEIPESNGTTLVLHLVGTYIAISVEPVYHVTVAADFPADGTTVRIHPFSGGRAELDLACEYSAFDKHSYIANGLGSGAMRNSMTVGTTLPDSLAGPPVHWPPSLTQYPIHPDNGIPGSFGIIPAGYFYLNGEWPADSNVATPVFSPVAAQYDVTPQNITITDATGGTTLYYTTNGVDPTNASAVYSGPVAISAAGSTTLKAVAYDGSEYSAIRTGVYTLKVATPTFSPVAGSYGSTQNVVLATTTSGAPVHYTLNGTTPTSGSATYSTALSISSTTTVKQIAVKTGLEDSAVSSATFTITGGGGGSGNTATVLGSTNVTNLIHP